MDTERPTIKDFAPAVSQTPEVIDTNKLKPEDFELDQASTTVKQYAPLWLARGGEHFVYDIPDHPDIVAKVHVGTLASNLRWNRDHDLTSNELSPEAAQAARDHLEQSQKQFRELQTYFGKEHTLAQRKALRKIPVTAETMRTLTGGQETDSTEVWAIAAVQRRAKEFNDPNRLGLVGGYAEFETFDPEFYKEVTTALLTGEQSDWNSIAQRFIKLQGQGSLTKLVKVAEKDEALKAQLQDFVRRAVDYTEQTGNILDILGDDNVIFSAQDGHWNYRLVDAAYPDFNPTFFEAKEGIKKLLEQDKLGEDGSAVLNAVNYVRTVNGLSAAVGSDRRISLMSSLEDNQIARVVELLAAELPKQFHG